MKVGCSVGDVVAKVGEGVGYSVGTYVENTVGFPVGLLDG